MGDLDLSMLLSFYFKTNDANNAEEIPYVPPPLKSEDLSWIIQSEILNTVKTAI